MSILVTPETKVLCQGMTGRAATFHCARMQSYGTKLVAGVTPGKGGQRHLDLPIFNSVSEAVEATGADASIAFVPPANVAPAIIEAIEAELSLVVCVTERVPVLDMVRVRQALEGSSTVLIGPNSQGLLAPGIAQLGVMTTVDAKPGRIGIASRSASLTSEIVAQTTAAGLGQSTTVGVGAIRFMASALPNVSNGLLRTPIRTASSSSVKSAAPRKKNSHHLLRDCARRSPSLRLLQGGMRRLNGAWGTPGRWQRVEPALRRQRSMPCSLPES